MPSEKNDSAFLWDMLDAAQTIIEFASGVRYDQYLKDRKLQMAVERGVEIIGEAARNISGPFKEAHPEIPWRLIVAQRNILAHEYGEIKQDRMWSLITKHLPELVLILEPLVPTPPVEK